MTTDISEKRYRKKFFDPGTSIPKIVDVRWTRQAKKFPYLAEGSLTASWGETA